MALKGNKGEWSEVYALFKILSEGKLHPGDANLNRIPHFFYPVISILRKEGALEKKFQISAPNVIITDGITPQLNIPIKDFAKNANSLLSDIKTSKGSSFAIKATEGFLNTFGCKTVKADSTKKGDIVINIHDPRTNLAPILGFSIKSKLGGSSTLFNASRLTNFTFEITNKTFTTNEINAINAIVLPSSGKIRRRVQAINSAGAELVFSNIEGAILNNNLVLIDSLLPQILSQLLLVCYQQGVVNLTDLTNHIAITNPLKYDNTHKHTFYSHKVKRFLSEVALGMVPKKVWDGVYDGTEGYIIIKEDGNVVIYHIINRNLFEDYLLSNTYLETPSSGRHHFGEIFEENGKQYFKLNLQIRFK